MAKKNTDDDELNYDYHPRRVIGNNFDDDKDRKEFVKLQEKNVADAKKVSDRMGRKGVPDSKKPI